MIPRLSPGALGQLPPDVARPDYDRSRIVPGIAHVGVGAFHRAHQEEFTDDLLALDPGPWGIVGINIRPPVLAPSLGEQSGLYTRFTLEGETAHPRVIGSLLRVVDSQTEAAPALAVLADPAIHVVTMTVTEKAYCHRPSDGRLDPDNPAIRHDLSMPDAPESLPGLLVNALALRHEKNAPVTLISCDNIPSNGQILRQVVRGLAEHRDPRLSDWIAANVAFPETMVDRIVPATASADLGRTLALGYRDDAVVVGESFRQWVIEDRFAGPRPEWERVGAMLVKDVEPFEILKMRVLNGAQTTLCTLGALTGLEHTSDDMADPVLSAFVERMLTEETLPTLRPVPGLSHAAYLAQSLHRLRNTAIRHRNHQIATDGSQKIVQRILNPIAERLDQGQGIALLAVPVAGWMAYLIRGAKRFGAVWRPDDPYAARVAAIADRIGRDCVALVEEITAFDGIFPARLSADARFRAAVSHALEGLLSDDPKQFVRDLCARA